VLSFILFYLHWEKFHSYKNLKEGIVLTTKISKAIHHFQQERELALSTNLKTQKGVEILQQLLKTKDHLQHLSPAISSSISSLSSLTSLLIQTYKIKDPRKVLSNYSLINERLLSSIFSILQISSDPNLTKAILAYSFFLHIKEKASIEKELARSFLNESTLEFQEAVNQQHLYEKLFKQIAPTSLFKSYEELFKEGEFSSVKEFREAVLSQKEIEENELRGYLQSMSLRLEKLKAFEDYLTSSILSTVEELLSKSFYHLWLYLLLFMAIFAIFILTTLQILRLLKKKSELKGILDRYVISSTTDLRGIITDVSEAFCKISGYSKEELIGKPHNIIRHPDMPKEVFKQMWQTISKGKVWEGEVKNKKKDGGSYWVRAVISPVYDEKGKRIGYTAVRQDITDKKKIEELNKTLEERVAREVQKSREKDKKMLQQSRLAQMGEMLSMIAHQWRQPLSAISTTASALNMKAKLGTIDPTSVKELTSKILSYTRHLSQTIDDFRDFFKSDKEKQETSWKEMIESVMGIIETSLHNKNIQLIKRIESNAIFYTHPNQVKQVILNLIKNAEDVLLERKVKEPKITLIAKDNLLIVKDNGGGIEEEILPKIFDPYFSTKLEKDGTGLGLYMSKTIIEDHCKGKLWVYNDEEGAVFVIELPPKEAVSLNSKKAS